MEFFKPLVEVAGKFNVKELKQSQLNLKSLCENL